MPAPPPKQHNGTVRLAHTQSNTNDTDHGGVYHSKTDCFGYYGNNGGYSTYLSGHQRANYTDRKRKFYQFDKSHELGFMDEDDKIDNSATQHHIEDRHSDSTYAQTSIPLAPPVVDEPSIDVRPREEQRLNGTMMRKNKT